jgi:hypothetical protein
MDLFAWTFDHWLALSIAAIVASSVIALVRMARNCPTLDDE